MSKERDPKITIALITGGLGCLGTICAAVIAGWLFNNSTTIIIPTIIIPTNPPAVTIVAPTQPETTLRVNNVTVDDICYIFISPMNADEWEPNWLGGEIDTLQAGTFQVFLVETGMYDLKAEGCNGEAFLEELQVHIQGDMIWTIEYP